MELSRQALIDKIQSKVTSIEDFNYDKLVAPPLYMLLSQQDIDALYNIATSIRYSGNPKLKYEAIDKIMKPRGFVKLSAGTNRIVYRHLESNDFVVKVAADDIGIHDNPKEFENQFIFKPFVTKVFEVSPCGTVGVFEKVNPITSREEFLSVADDIYEVINSWFIGKYILADIGTKFFMNWGIRTYSTGTAGSVAFGPVLLDFPYVYELDGNKMFCSAIDHNNTETGRCGGVIDYDDGFNFLYCTKCGVKYRVKELSKKIKNNEIVINRRRENKKMKIAHYDNNGNLVLDNEVVKPSEKKVTTTRETPKKGSLKIDFSKLQEFNSEKNVIKEEEQPKVNNALRTNPASSRGIVKAPATETNMKIAVPTSDDKIVEEEYKNIIDKKDKKEFFEIVSYESEYDLLTISNGDEEVTAKLRQIIPEEELQVMIENSEEYTKLAAENKSMTSEIEKLQSAREDDKKEIEKLKEDIKNSDASEEINELKAEIEKLKAELKDASSHIDVKVVNGIPRERNNEDIDVSEDYYGEASVLHGVTECINGFASPKNKDARRTVIVFPTDEESCEYLPDANNNTIVVGTINGYLIDDLMEAAEEQGIKKVDEVEEEETTTEE